MSQQPYVQLANVDAKPETSETACQPPAQAATVPSQKQSATTDQQLVAVPQSQMFCQAGTNFGQPQMFYGHTPPQPGMQLFVQPAPQAISCVPVQPPVQPVTVTLPRSLQPYSFLGLSITITTVCSILNITALVFGIPALLLSILSVERNRTYQYEDAKRFGAIALALNIINITYTFIIITLAIGLGLGLALQDCYDYYYC